MTPTETAEVLETLTQTPPRLARLSEALPEPAFRLRPDPEAWSANEILAHLRACADVWGRIIFAMLEQDRPSLRYVSPRTWIKKTNYLELEFGASLPGFTVQRAELLQVLQTIKVEQWSRGAIFTGRTTAREQAVLGYARRLAGHEDEHCAQLDDLLNSTRTAIR